MCEQICRVLQAANYLNIKSLLDLTCLTVANMIKGAAEALPRMALVFAHHEYCLCT